MVNKDLADVLGNFVNRVTKFCVARFDGKVPGEGEYGDEEKALCAELDGRVAQYTEHLEALEFRKALGELRAIWVAGNEYLTRAAPWTHIKTDRARAAAAVRMGLNLVHLFGHLAWPVIPTCRARHPRQRSRTRPRSSRGPTSRWRNFSTSSITGMPIRAPDVLFAKITDEQIAEWTARFGGSGARERVRDRADRRGRRSTGSGDPAGSADAAPRRVLGRSGYRGAAFTQ